MQKAAIIPQMCDTGLIVTLRFHIIAPLVFFCLSLADSDPSYAMNSGCKDANGERRDAAVPDGMCHCKDSYFYDLSHPDVTN